MGRPYAGDRSVNRPPQAVDDPAALNSSVTGSKRLWHKIREAGASGRRCCGFQGAFTTCEAHERASRRRGRVADEAEKAYAAQDGA